MGAGSKVARQYWLQNLCKEIRSKLDAGQQTVALPELRVNGVEIGEVAKRLGQWHSVLVREIDGANVAALSLEALGVTDVELTPAGYR